MGRLAPRRAKPEAGEPIDAELLEEAPTVRRTAAEASSLRSPQVSVQPLSKVAAGQPKLTLTSLVAAWWVKAKASGRKPSTYEGYRNTLTAGIA